MQSQCCIDNINSLPGQKDFMNNEIGFGFESENLWLVKVFVIRELMHFKIFCSPKNKNPGRIVRGLFLTIACATEAEAAFLGWLSLYQLKISKTLISPCFIGPRSLILRVAYLTSFESERKHHCGRSDITQ